MNGLGLVSQGAFDAPDVGLPSTLPLASLIGAVAQREIAAAAASVADGEEEEVFGYGALLQHSLSLHLRGESAVSQQFRKRASPCEKRDVYTGELRDLKKWGRGTMIYANGNRYEGEWEEDRPQGLGTMVYESGHRYQGQWREGLKDGEGTMTYPRGDLHTVYTGQWRMDRFEGEGTMRYESGASYTGQWRAGVREGVGTFTYAAGDLYKVYEGEWSQDKLHGRGSMAYASGVSYTGLWREDHRCDGEGTMTYPNGNSYQGEWKNHTPHGKGVYCYGGRAFCEGEWQEGCKHGLMTMKFLSGTAPYTSCWEQGRIQIGSEADALAALVSPVFVSGLLGLSEDISFLIDLPTIVLARYLRDPLLEKGHELRSLPLTQARQLIKEILQEPNGEIVYPYHARSLPNETHAVGLKMKRDGDVILVTIFNSGFGLERWHFKSGKYYETKREFKITCCLFDEVCDQLFPLQGKIPVQDVYRILISGSIASLGESSGAVLQTPQKSGNCSVEWVFAYLKTTMAERDYHQMRLDLFRKCLEGAQRWERPDPQVIEILRQKIAKREDKMIRSSALARKA